MSSVHPARFLTGTDTIVWIAPLVYGDRTEPGTKYKIEGGTASDLQINKKNQTFQLFAPPIPGDLSPTGRYVDAISTGIEWSASFKGFIIKNGTGDALDDVFGYVEQAANSLEDEVFLWHQKFLQDDGVNLHYLQRKGAVKIMDYSEPTPSDGPGEASWKFMGVGPLTREYVTVPRA